MTAAAARPVSVRLGPAETAAVARIRRRERVDMSTAIRRAIAAYDDANDVPSAAPAVDLDALAVTTAHRRIAANVDQAARVLRAVGDGAAETVVAAAEALAAEVAAAAPTEALAAALDGCGRRVNEATRALHTADGAPARAVATSALFEALNAGFDLVSGGAP